MRSLRGRVCALTFLLVFFSCTTQSFGAQAEVVRNVNLRSDPSSANPPIRLLEPPEVVTLLETAKTNGYYHVRTDLNEVGWVWARNVEVQDEAVVSGVTAPPGVADAIPGNWQKPTPNKTTFHGQQGDCPWNGNNGDPDTYWRKNRTDLPSTIHDVSWSAITQLAYPVAKPKRKDWTQQQLDDIAPYEGVPLRVIGYLVAIKPQSGNSEGTNCGHTASTDTDIHLALVKSQGDAESSSVVIEVTPRFKPQHPNWTKSKLTPWLDTDKPVRITGWLILDPDHRNHLNRYRSTLWEIHPITKIEVFRDGSWVDLDSL
jgi:Bacterial SH3 domain